MYERILVPTDGSEAALAAAEEGVELAAELGASVHALYVVDATTLSAGGPDASGELMRDALEDAGQAAVDDVAALAAEAGVDCDTAVRGGVPHTAIADYAEEADIGLVVMGTHGRTGIEHFLLGSVTEKTVRTADVPVLTVRPGE